MGLKQACEDQNLGFSTQNGIMFGIARRFITVNKIWVDQYKSACDSGIIN